MSTIQITGLVVAGLAVYTAVIILATMRILAPSSPTDSESYNDLIAHVETENERALDNLRKSHDAQLAALEAQLEADRQAASAAFHAHAKNRQTRRVEYVERITTNDTAIGEEITKATNVDAPIISGTPTTLELKRPAVLGLLVANQQAQEQITHEKLDCELRISELRQEIMPDCMATAQRWEQANLRLTQENDLARREARQFENALADKQADLVTWAVVSGLVGLAVGGAIATGVIVGVGI